MDVSLVSGYKNPEGFLRERYHKLMMLLLSTNCVPEAFETPRTEGSTPDQHTAASNAKRHNPQSQSQALDKSPFAATHMY